MFRDDYNKLLCDTYGVDVLNDIVLKNDQHLVFCFDWTKRFDSRFYVLKGDIHTLGVEKREEYFFSDLVSLIEINNPISEIFGRKNFIDDFIKFIDTLTVCNEYYLPVRTNSGLIWLVCGLKTITKKDDKNELIYGRVHWISTETPNAIDCFVSTYKDNLTGLFTKNTLRAHLERVRNTDHSFGIFFDIDNFKRINDIFGHKLGDSFLKMLGKKFISAWEEDIMYYRLGGDEFFVYMVNSTEEEVYKKSLQIIYDVETLNEQGQQVEVSASIGIVPIIGNGFDFDSLLDLADKAMYHSKGKGKGHISFARDV
jgi:diguanylate cyclase (GGDEF)-like protein